MSIGIRPMQPDELDEIARLWCRSKQEAYLPWLAIEATYSFEDNLDYFRDTVCANHRVWLAERDGTVVGLMAQAGDFIDQLFVDPDHQRAGVGTALLAWARLESPAGSRCSLSGATRAPGVSTRSTASARSRSASAPRPRASRTSATSGERSPSGQPPKVSPPPSR